jgi:hypothetical protein
MHPALDPLDPLRLDRALAETHRRARGWLRRCREGRDLENDPFEITRWASGQSALRAVEELAPEDPLRAPLRRWVYRLLQLRVNHGTLVALAHERYARAVPLDGPDRVQAPVATALRTAVGEPRRRDAWLHAFRGAADATAHAARGLEERRQEVASRLGLESPDVLESACAGATDLAEEWLAMTTDAFAEHRPRSLAQWIAHASAEGADEGWPRQLSSASLGPWFAGTDLFRSLDLDPGAFPPSVCAASTLRALARLGAAWVDAVAPVDQPFVIAHDALGLRRRRVGALFAALPLLPAFARRHMDVPKTKADDQLRLLYRAVLFESRALALRVLLRRSAFAGARRFCEAFEAETERALGCPLPGPLAGALFRLHEDDVSRFTGLMLAASDLRGLEDTHDEDWFRNPRAIDQLRAENALPPSPAAPEEAVSAGMRDLLGAITRRG